MLNLRPNLVARYTMDDLILPAVAMYPCDDREDLEFDVVNTGTSLTEGLASTETTNLSIAAKLGDGFDFTASASVFVDCLQTFQSTFRDTFMIDCWIKPDDGQPGGDRTIAGVIRGNTIILIKLRPDGTIAAIYGEASVEDGVEARTAAAVFADGATSLTHLSVVFVADSQIYIYVDNSLKTLDGSFDGDMSGLTFADYTSSDNLYFGATNFVGTDVEHFDGIIDALRIVSFDASILTPAEAAAIVYNNGTGTEATGFILDSVSGDYAEQNGELSVVAGQINNAFDTDGGSNDWIDTLKTFQSIFQGSFTISLWINFDDGQNGEIFQYIFGGINAAANEACYAYVTGTGMPAVNGSIRFSYISNGNQATLALSAGGVIANGLTGYHHILIAADSTSPGAGKIKIYLDGVDVTSSGGDTSGVTFSQWGTGGADNFIIGGASLAGTPVGSITGMELDNTLIFNKLLSQAEITMLFNNGNAGSGKLTSMNLKPIMRGVMRGVA